MSALRLAALEPAALKSALRTIFDVLGADTFRSRREVTRKVRRIATEYLYRKEFRAKEPSTVERFEWMQSVIHHAKSLADLLEPDRMYPPDFATVWTLVEADPSAFVTQLKELTRFQPKPGKPAQGRSKEMPMRHLIFQLSQLYLTLLGEKPGLSRGRDHHKRSERHNAPSGPFFRLVSATLALVRDERTPEQIAYAIKQARKIAGYGPAVLVEWPIS